MSNNQISAHFTWDEVIHSETALRMRIDNKLPDALVVDAINTADNMERVRSNLEGNEIRVSSWYRCSELEQHLNWLVFLNWCSHKQVAPSNLMWNEYLNGKDHPKAKAVDFTCPDFGTPLEICKRLMQYKNELGFKQLILEHTWVHISWDSDPLAKPKLEVLTLLESGGYAIGLTDKQGNAV